MKGFQTKHYEIKSEKIKKHTEIKIAFLTDLHGLEFGEGNCELIEVLEQEKPDAVLIAGDMIIRAELKTFSKVAGFMKNLSKKFRVYYALGNHEYGIMMDMEKHEHYAIYEKHLVTEGICVLHNQKIGTRINGNNLVIYGLEIPMQYYKKPFSPYLEIEEMEKLIGRCSSDEFGILLAHNPKYGKTYMEWGADLTLSGHFHGGVVRFDENHGLLSPQYLLFPPYCCGRFEENGRNMIVSAGLGEHTIPLRIHNPRELIMITLKSTHTCEKTE